MVRNYIRKIDCGNFSEQNMLLAIDSVKLKEMSLRKAALTFSVNKDALLRRFQRKLKNLEYCNIHKRSLGSFKKVLLDDTENQLVSYIEEMDSVYYGLSISDIQQIVFRYVEKYNIVHPFNKYNGVAGRDFVSGFLKRHPDLLIRKPQGLSLNRINGLNCSSVNIYFKNIEIVLKKYKFEAHQIFYCDESGITTVHEPVKVITKKGKHCISSVRSGKRGVTTTIVYAMIVTGLFVPPMMILKRKRMKLELIDHAPTGTIKGCSKNGWITTDLFMEYIKHFTKYTRASIENKILLILDGHKTHTKNINLLDFAKENGIVVITLPPHTSHKLQPLDRSFFKPIKTFYNIECGSWLREHPGRKITTDQLGVYSPKPIIRLPL
ncbi:uncharacterized protein LOC136074370 [Hydra vulgaris]|uniref:Uncharacterized protein LOC136074370 n=1 Tax=Hydra vulgaris TaxID=6087 RepID=A0ABM4B1T4_HYDVU